MLAPAWAGARGSSVTVSESTAIASSARNLTVTFGSPFGAAPARQPFLRRKRDAACRPMLPRGRRLSRAEGHPRHVDRGRPTWRLHATTRPVRPKSTGFTLPWTRYLPAGRASDARSDEVVDDDVSGRTVDIRGSARQRSAGHKSRPAVGRGACRFRVVAGVDAAKVRDRGPAPRRGRREKTQ